jgi:hypothetical protein
MARGSVQFQKGLSEATFDDLYGTEEKYRGANACVQLGQYGTWHRQGGYCRHISFDPPKLYATLSCGVRISLQ